MPSPFRTFLDRSKGLRVRLTLSYLLFFSVLLLILGILFRQSLVALYDRQMHAILEEEWGAVRGFLRIEKGRINWYYDRDDPEEALIVDRLRQLYVLAELSGTVRERGPRYRELPLAARTMIARTVISKGPLWTKLNASSGEEILVRSGLLLPEGGGSPFYIALGRSYTERDQLMDEFTRFYALLLPLMIASAGLLGWFASGRALVPVNEVARTAEQITGSNLTASIPLRGAKDELDRLIESFNRMIVRLRDSFTQTRQFSTDVSHELRTPLTAIRGQLEVALISAKTTEQYRDAILDVLEDVERLTRTIRGLLLLSQAETGQLVLQKERLNVCALAADASDQFQIPAEGSGLALTTDLISECFVQADRMQIERLFSNLLSNAVKYTPSGGRIDIKVSTAGRFAEVIVQDTGQGIGEDHLPYIFDRFYRVPDQGSESSPERGLGLGLSFVAWIVKAHEGRIDVRSSLGAGTRFRVLLPLASGKIQ